VIWMDVVGVLKVGYRDSRQDSEKITEVIQAI